MSLAAKRSGFALAVGLMLFVTTGASCPRVLRQYAAPAPVVFEEQPTLAEVITVVNTNSAKVRQLQTVGAKLTVPGAPRLRASISYQQAKNFRLIADTGLTGVELDMGSNADLFWMWVKRNDPPAIYFCRHDELHGSGVHQVMPIEPAWLIEALGVVRFDPRDQHEGPSPVGQGRLEIKSHIRSGGRELTKVTILNDTTGWVIEQHLYDSDRTLLASTQAYDHKYDKEAEVTLPRKVEIKLPTMGMQFTIDIADFIVNRLDGDPDSLFAMPERSSAPPVNLGRGQPLPNHFGPAVIHSPEPSQNYTPQPPPIRGRRQTQPVSRTPTVGEQGRPHPAETRIFDEGTDSVYNRGR